MNLTEKEENPMSELTDLSPTAQKLVNAYEETSDKYKALAAVLLAVVNDVAPENYRSYTGFIDQDGGYESRNYAIREAILSLYDELNKF
jgi:predicted Zn-dependent protease